MRVISPIQHVSGTDWEEVWIITEESAILLIGPPDSGIFTFFPLKEAHFSAYSLSATTSCAIRGQLLSKQAVAGSYPEDWRLGLPFGRRSGPVMPRWHSQLLQMVSAFFLRFPSRLEAVTSCSKAHCWCGRPFTKMIVHLYCKPDPRVVPD
jgi:hypothetical protein